MVGWLIPWLVTMKVKYSIPSCDTYNLRPTSGLHMHSGGLQLSHMPRSALDAQGPYLPRFTFYILGILYIYICFILLPSTSMSH